MGAQVKHQILEGYPAKFYVNQRGNFRGRHYKSIVRSDASLTDLLSTFKKTGLQPMKREYNKEKFNEVLYSNANIGFKGGTYEELFEPRTNISRFKNAEKKLKANKLYKKLAFTFDKASAKKRIRTYSKASKSI